MGSGASKKVPEVVVTSTTGSQRGNVATTTVVFGSQHLSHHIQQKPSLVATVQAVNSNAKLGFLSSVKYAVLDPEDAPVSPVSPAPKFRSGSRSPLADRTRVSLEHKASDWMVTEKEAEAMTTSDLFSARTPYAVPNNFQFNVIGAQSGAIRHVSMSSDGAQVVSVVDGLKVCSVLETLSGRPLMQLRGHLDQVLCCAMSRDSKSLLTSCADGSVTLYDLNNGKKLREVPVLSVATCCAISDDSESIATSSIQDFVHLWDMRGDSTVTFRRHSSTIMCINFCRKFQWIVSGASNGEVFVWDYTSCAVHATFTLHRASVNGASFSLDGHRLVTIDDTTLRVWDLFTVNCVYIRSLKGDVTGPDLSSPAATSATDMNQPRFTTCCFAGGSLIVATTSTKHVLVLDPNCGKEVLSLSSRGPIQSSCINWNGDSVCFGDSVGNLYKLSLSFSSRDVALFNLASKVFSKEGKIRVD